MATSAISTQACHVGFLRAMIAASNGLWWLTMSVHLVQLRALSTMLGGKH
jgi:hypothetical protein